MARGPKKHLKRVNAPKSWMLGKMTGVFAPRPSSGAHPMRQSLPLILILRDRLKYALTGQETKMICMQKHVTVDGRVRTDSTYPAGYMDVVSIRKSNDTFRLLYDTKGRFTLHPIDGSEKTYKLCRVNRMQLTLKKVPFIGTHDGRTIRYPDPLISVNDTVKVDIATGKILEHCKYEVGALAQVTKGRNTGRIGVITSIEKHEGSFAITTVRDAAGHTFATRLGNVFVIGKSADEPMVSLPRQRGVKLSILEERNMRLRKMQQA
eukprot:CAMPEP_0198429390 /NCGR_PEP_ID=MMETSP1452-20131203/7304_1 /TAXON_ID=1181717 /ORGANISM="Synchroma pusillum, Strain CCMP3072" /LENGTH=263 /DNA_ID=CAMNT_0044149797 /DNA_START=16 /DNA_END=807 /DNA_ORIENTATION=+